MSQVQLPNGLFGGEASRLGNEMIRAKQAAFGGNAAAVNSLRQITQGIHRRPRSQVSGYQDTSASVGALAPMPGPPAAAAQPSIAPSESLAQPGDPIQEYNKNQAIEHIISSPEMMDTVTRLKLRNHFKGRSDDGIGTEAFSMIRGKDH